MITFPQYQLSTGRRFTYRTGNGGVPDAEITIGAPESVEWNFYVIDCDQKGISRIVFSQGPVESDGSSPRRVFSSEGYFDISDRGEIIENVTVTPLANPTSIFPCLPRSAPELASGWSASLNVDGTQREFSLRALTKPATDGKFRFTENSRTALDAAYLASRVREYDFDCERGLVQSVTTTFRRSWPVDQAPTSETICLAEVNDLVSSEVKMLATSAGEYFDACAEYQQYIELALWDVTSGAHWLQKAGDALEMARAGVTHPFVRKWLERKVAVLEKERAGLLGDIHRLAEAIGKPAPAWQAKDMEGVDRESLDFRNRPLVLCFWDRGCSWSLRTLLELNRAAAEMKDRSVAFMGIGAEKNLESARYMWRSLGMRFPTMLDDRSAESIAASYLVDGYPATVVIDRDGIVRRIRSGHSFTIGSVLAAEISKLEEATRVTELRT